MKEREAAAQRQKEAKSGEKIDFFPWKVRSPDHDSRKKRELAQFLKEQMELKQQQSVKSGTKKEFDIQPTSFLNKMGFGQQVERELRVILKENPFYLREKGKEGLEDRPPVDSSVLGQWRTHSLSAYSTHSHTHSLTHPLTYSHTDSFTHSLNHTLKH